MSTTPRYLCDTIDGGSGGNSQLFVVYQALKPDGTPSLNLPPLSEHPAGLPGAQIVVFLPGFDIPAPCYFQLAQKLAMDSGAVVAIPSVIGPPLFGGMSRLDPGAVGSFAVPDGVDELPGNAKFDNLYLGGTVARVLKRLLEHHTSKETSPLYQKLLFDKIILAGHSAGGASSLGSMLSSKSLDEFLKQTGTNEIDLKLAGVVTYAAHLMTPKQRASQHPFLSLPREPSNRPPVCLIGAEKDNIMEAAQVIYPGRPASTPWDPVKSTYDQLLPSDPDFDAPVYSYFIQDAAHNTILFPQFDCFSHPSEKDHDSVHNADARGRIEDIFCAFVKSCTWPTESAAKARTLLQDWTVNIPTWLSRSYFKP